MNWLWEEIKDLRDWEYINKTYKQKLNKMSSEFKKLCPKNNHQ